MEGMEILNLDGKKEIILSINDVKSMFDIINSGLGDEIIATKLSSYCDYHTILESIRMYNIFELDGIEQLNNLKLVYEDLNKTVGLNLEKISCKINLEEINQSLMKINKAIEIINSDDNEYNKAEKLLELYKNAEDLRKNVALLIKYGKSDESLDNITVPLDNYDNILNYYKELEDKGIFDNIKYALSIKDYFYNYQYASFVINHYITSSKSYIERMFLRELGISKEVYDFCLKTIEELDVELYKKYQAKKEENAKIRHIRNTTTIENLAEGIKTGILPDGTEFNMLEFLKRIPFKNKPNFISTLTQFMRNCTPNEYHTIMSYIRNNRLNADNVFKPLEVKTLYEMKIIINGIELTKQDIDTIVDYLKLNGFPVINKTFVLARTKYLNGEFTKETIREQKQKSSQNSNKVKVLIPSCK